ncbi:hypothetical protein RclHR1_15090006 [Rhizophagus clarus]|uniref:F-box domain-containing protein n=1 Tax=Rhizophagus clarus TaxID=94130 RepID=A0A2Z6QEB9_9GLOM|nr:hypothetical protein RclHR1_15090006 [Rhizophagus clarus]GES77278.1 hypothetical protein GLOIN_2v1784962 [Rhizophagus clarus]
MFKLNEDILYLISKELKELQNIETLLSCLTVNKVWCEITVPILWEDPWKYSKGNDLLLNVIISHLSDESRKNLLSKGVDFLTNYQRPFFDYISFCKYLNFINLNELISAIDIHDKDIFLIVKKEIINLFINENTRFSHLYIPYQFDYQLHHIPEAKSCFSELEFLSCSTSIKNDILFGIIEICKSIKELEFIIEKGSNYEIVKLVKTPKKLFKVHLLTKWSSIESDEPFCKILENSLIKHANTIQNFKITNNQPTTKILSYLTNLNRLELDGIAYRGMWRYLEDLSLPFLQSLKTRCVPIQGLTSIIKNTNGSLNEISIGYIHHDEIGNEKIIQTIYQKCLNLKYLKLTVRNRNILEFEKLLNNCQYIDGLCIIIDNDIWFNNKFNWELLFEVLIRSSPTNLFKFYFHKPPKFKSLKSFFDDWKGKRSMLLQIIQDNSFGICNEIEMQYFDLLEEYKAQGIIKKYDYNHLLRKSITFEDFEWIQENI